MCLPQAHILYQRPGSLRLLRSILAVLLNRDLKCCTWTTLGGVFHSDLGISSQYSVQMFLHTMPATISYGALCMLYLPASYLLLLCAEMSLQPAPQVLSAVFDLFWSCTECLSWKPVTFLTTQQHLKNASTVNKKESMYHDSNCKNWQASQYKYHNLWFIIKGFNVHCNMNS